MHSHVFMALALVLASPPAPADALADAPTLTEAEGITKITSQMNAVAGTGKKKGESTEDFCARIQPIWEAGRHFKNSKDKAFRLARSVFAHKRRTDWGCPQSSADKADPDVRRRSLWDRFDETRRDLGTAPSREERAAWQESLRWAAVSLLHSLSPTDPRYQDVIDSLALSVAPKDKTATLQVILESLAPGDLEGDRGKAIANAMSRLAQEIPPKAFAREQIDSLISFAIRVAEANPAWLQEESAGRFLEVVLNSLGQLPPEKVGEAQAQAVFDFTAKLLALDPRWLEGSRSAVLAELIPRLLERLDVAKVKREDLGVMLEFTAKVMAGRPEWPAEVRKVIDDWEQILQIAIETKTPATRAIIEKAVKTLQKREGDAWKPLADEVSKSKPDPQLVTSLLQALGVAGIEEVREEKAALERLEVVEATFQRLRTLIGMRLPAGCHDRQRDGSSECAPALAFADAFRKNIVTGGPEGADFGLEIETTVPEALARAECTLLPPQTGKRVCQSFKDANGTFASFVALEITRVTPAEEGGSLAAKAGCVVISGGGVADRVDQVGIVRFSAERESPGDAIVAAEALAKQVLDRCPLSRPYNDFATELLAKGRVDPDLNASSALVFAGLPYLRDPRVPPTLADGISAADFVTLFAGASSLASAIYVHNTSDGPWGDRLLQVGLVSLGVNILVKVAATAYYAHHYGHH